MKDARRIFDFISRAAQQIAYHFAPPSAPAARRRNSSSICALSLLSHDSEEAEGGAGRCTRCHCSAQTPQSRDKLAQPGAKRAPTAVCLYMTAVRAKRHGGLPLRGVVPHSCMRSKLFGFNNDGLDVQALESFEFLEHQAAPTEKFLLCTRCGAESPVWRSLLPPCLGQALSV